MPTKAKTSSTCKVTPYKASTSKAPKLKGGLEKKVVRQLEKEGIRFRYEARRISYVPLKPQWYKTDFDFGEGIPIVIETKGWFRTSRERTRFLDIRAAHPELDIRFVFSNANKPISKGSKTTYADWCDKHGFKWATGGVIPDEWLEELKQRGTALRAKTGD